MGGALNLEVAGDLTVASLNAAGQAVTLTVAGAVLDGDTGSDNTDISAATLNITAASVGTGSAALDTAADKLVLNTTGEIYLSESDALSLSGTVGGALNLAVAGDLTVGSLNAAGQTVTLTVAGAVRGGNMDSDNTDISAATLNIAAASVGSSDRALDTAVGHLSLALGSGGAQIAERDGLVLGSVTADGSVALSTLTGNLSLDAAVTLTGEADLRLSASTGAVTQTARSTVRTAAGDVQVQGLSGAALARVSTDSGRIQVAASEGVFTVPGDSNGIAYGDQPVRIQGIGVDIGAPISGTGTLELAPSNQDAELSGLSADNARQLVSADALAELPIALPIVIGAGAGTADDQGLVLDQAELARLVDGFERIVIGSQDPRQVITVDGSAQAVVFRDPLVLVASGVAQTRTGDKLSAGEVHINGTLAGEGLSILGSGSTTTLTAAHIVQAGDVLINDSLVVSSNSTIEVSTAGGLLELRGSVLVKAGATLTLLADRLSLGSYADRGDSLVLEAGATLIVGTQALTVDQTLRIDGGGAGSLVLHGNALGGQVADFSLSQAELDNLAAQMVDGSFAALTLGHAGADTVLRSPALWAEGAGSIALNGQVVQLGRAGDNASWQLGEHTTLRATTGDLWLQVDLLSSNGAYLNLVAEQGQVRMAADTSIRSEGGLVTFTAASGIEVGRIDTSGASGTLQGAVALDSAGGRIVLASNSDTNLGVRAQTVSFFGYGQAVRDTGGDRVLRVEAERLQVSGPTGLISSGLSADGSLVYRLSDRQGAYVQLRLQGAEAERVLLPRGEVASQPVQTASQLALGATVSAGFTQHAQSMARLGGLSASASSAPQTQAYLAAFVQPMLQGLSLAQAWDSRWITVSDAAHLEQDLLSDLAYGFDDTAPNFVLGLPALQTSSAGVLLADEVPFDYLISE